MGCYILRYHEYHITLTYLSFLCIQGAKLGEACNANTVCSVPGSGCSPDGTCQCGGEYPRRTDDGYCATLELPVVGESCPGPFTCMTFVSDCVNGVCECIPEFRAATPQEIYAEPDSWRVLGKCRGVDHSPKTITGWYFFRSS